MAERPVVEPSPELWGGHSLEDDCDRLNLIISGLPNQKLIRRQNLALLEVYDSLDSFLTSWQEGSNEPIETLRQGEFRLRDYPNGTIIRYSRDRWRDDFYSVDVPSWGIITQLEDSSASFRDVSVGIPNNDLESYVNLLTGFLPQLAVSRITLGEVKHFRFREMHLPTGNIPALNSLIRYNWVEIWKLGDMERKLNRPKGFKQRRK